MKKNSLKMYIVLISLLALILSAGANLTWIPGPPIIKTIWGALF